MFKVGQKIIFIDEPGEGRIIEIRPNGLFLIEDEHGFTRTYPKDKIAEIRISNEQLKSITGISKIKTEESTKKVVDKRNSTPEIIDLHMHELVDRHEHWSNSEIVNYQMDHLKRALEQLMVKRVKRVHIVHGVGEGKLRTEVRHYLRKFANCEINDLSYTRNGFGATEFVIRYKGNV